MKAVRIPFQKMHGLGNDFVVLDSREPTFALKEMSAQRAIQLCDRHFGIGADQLLWLTTPKNAKAHVRMEIWDADGSTAEMCGNGVRAIALYLREKGLEDSPLEIETPAGIKTITNVGPVQNAFFRVNMGAPQVRNLNGESLKIDAEHEVTFFEVNMGNPHAVIWEKNPETAKARALSEGPRIEHHPRFPKKTNVEFVYIESPHRLVAHVWERGAGITLACGTGACAVAAAAIATGKAKSPVQVVMPGGEMTLEWSGKDADPVFMSGPATHVYHGVFLLS